MNAHAIRVHIHALEVDAESLKRDPVKNADALQVLTNVLADLYRRLGEQTGSLYAVALQLSDGPKVVRLIVDNQHVARLIETAWFLNHPGGGATRQRADYCEWSQPYLASFHNQPAASIAAIRRTA